MNFKGKSALITGGSRGLGLALGKALAGVGARVVLVARDSDALSAAVDAVRATVDNGDGGVYGLAADIGDKRAIHQIAGQAAALVGDIDILIHNASTLGVTPMPLLIDTECEDLERVLAVNLIGPFRLSKVIAGSMALRGSGTVVHISSDAAVESYPSWGAYGASKAALDHMNRTWAAEMPNLRFVSVDPGEMDTAMHAAAMPDADPATLARPDEVAARILAILAAPDRAASGSRQVAANWPLGQKATEISPGEAVL